jgi:hypothetical protein
MALLKAQVDGAWVTVGGAGVPAGGSTGQVLVKTTAADYDTRWLPPMHDLPAGGATNAILAKSGAADYATAWTTTPILTDLSVVDTTTPVILHQRTGGSPPIAWYTQIHSVGSLVIGHSADPDQFNLGLDFATRGVVLGAGLNVPGDLTVGGTLTSKHAVRAVALINGGTGAVELGFGVTGASRTAPGRYTLTFPSLTYAVVFATAAQAANVFIHTTSQTATSIAVNINDAAGAAADCWFNVMIVSP